MSGAGRQPEPGNIAATRTGDAIAGPGGFANSGVYIGTAPVAQSGYLRQVELMLPDGGLVGRAKELAELTRFCTDEHAGPYVWWRAPAWAGKSALLATFVLDPPDGVRVVSFFITARWSGHSDRVGFTDIVIEQLAELLGRPMPSFLTDATRDSSFRQLLADAAHACQRAGERLVLVVDGLDEDRGVGPGARPHSIAGLLPAQPPAGMRIIVAGRPNPPIPSDVPARHPLRSKAVVRELERSRTAAMIREDAEADLKEMLNGSPAQRDLLGLVTVAGGGLAAADLADLARMEVWEVNDLLRTVSGRTFSRRRGRWQAETEVYLLGHEDLHVAASRLIKLTERQRYRRSLYDWADRYRQLGWPVSTPEYLLRGYFRLLSARNKLPRMISCATDTARHDRMLAVSGGDHAALTEIATTHRAVLGQEEPDLAALVRLLVHREALTDRNSGIPAELPAVWFRLGQRTRAENLANSITEPADRARALVEIARTAGRMGDPAAAAAFLQQAETAARESPAGASEQALVDLVHAAGQLGDLDRAYAVMATLTDPHRAAEARVRLAKVVAAEHAEDLLADAERAAQQITDRRNRTVALADVAAAMIRTGHPYHAGEIVATITAPHGEALDIVVDALAAAGDDGMARSLIGRLPVPDDQSRALSHLARAIAKVGDIGRADAVARSIGDPFHRGQAVAGIRQATATRTAVPATSISDAIVSGRWRVDDLLDTDTGAPGLDAVLEMAANKASGVIEDHRAAALSRVARAAAEHDRPERAAVLAAQAEGRARAPRSADRQVRTLVAVAAALARVGDRARTSAFVARAADLVAALPPALRSSALSDLAEAVGDDAQATMPAEKVARRFATRDLRAARLAERAGPDDQARLLLEALRAGDWRHSLDALSRIAPEATFALADAVLATTAPAGRQVRRGGERRSPGR